MSTDVKLVRLKSNSEDVFPITHFDAVKKTDGTTLTQALATQDTTIAANQTAALAAASAAQTAANAVAAHLDQDVKTTSTPTLTGLDLSTPVIVAAGSVKIKDDTTLSSNIASYTEKYSYTANRISGVLRIFHTLTGSTNYSSYYKLKVTLNDSTIYEGTLNVSSDINAYTDVTFSAGDTIKIYLFSSPGTSADSAYVARSVISIGIASRPTNLLQDIAVDKEVF